jgi:hypothetical protein
LEDVLLHGMAAELDKMRLVIQILSVKANARQQIN